MAFRRQVKNFVKNYSDAEIKVREATSNDPWGPSSSLMLDISDLTFNTVALSEIMNMLWHRLNDHGKNWRHVYKSLTLMDYLIKNGSKKVIQHCRERFCNLQTLKEFQHIDEAGKDQGYHIREKSKQVITLLMDEQLLHKEREVACRTRRRTSHPTAFPKRLPGAGYASKAGTKQKKCQNIQLPPETTLPQEVLPLRINAWQSTEDLMLFYDDDPKPVLPAVAPSTVSSATGMSEGEAEAANLWDADAIPTSLEKSPSLQTNVSLEKKPDSTLTNTVIENPLQTPLEKQLAVTNSEALTPLPAFQSSSKEEFISPTIGVSESDSTFYNQTSVETLYVSPSFKTFDHTKKIIVNRDSQKPAAPSMFQVDDEDLVPLTTWVVEYFMEHTKVKKAGRCLEATFDGGQLCEHMLCSQAAISSISEGISSFSTSSMSSPDLACPEKSVHISPPVLAGPSSWTSSHQPSSSASFKGNNKTAVVHHPFVPGGPVSSDEEEIDNLDIQEILPDTSDSAKNKTIHISSMNWTESSQTTDHFTSVSCARFQTTKGLPTKPESNNSITVLLGEVKDAIVRLHEDLSMVIQELHAISSHLVSMSENSQQISKSLQVTQSTEGSSGEM